MTWPLVTALLLILLKQILKILINHKPDKVDFLKMMASFPVDISFLVVGLFIRRFSIAGYDPEKAVCMMVVYLLVSVFVTFLGRVSEGFVVRDFDWKFLLIMPFNFAVSSMAFYFALNIL